MPLTTSETITAQLHILQAEYEALYEEHKMHHEIRERLSTNSMVATLALIGAILGQFSILSNNPITLKLFLVIPLFFTCLSWWFVRTNHSNLLIEEYILRELRPKMIDLLGGSDCLNWLVFMWTYDKSLSGSFVRFFQTLARLGLINLPAILSLLVFWWGSKGNQIDGLDYGLLILNIIGFIMSIIMIRETNKIVKKIQNYIKTQHIQGRMIYSSNH